MLAVEPSLVRHVYAIWRHDAARRPPITATVDAFHTHTPT